MNEATDNDGGYVGELKRMSLAELLEHAKEFASQAGKNVNWLQAQLLVIEFIDRFEAEKNIMEKLP